MSSGYYGHHDYPPPTHTELLVACIVVGLALAYTLFR